MRLNRWESQRKNEQCVLNEKKSSQAIFPDKTVTSLGRKLEKQYGIDHRKEKHMTWEEGCTSSESENCGSKIEKSQESFKVENQKSENALALNKISLYLNQLIRFKEWNIEVDNFSHFLGKVLYSYATTTLKNIKPAAKFPPSDIIYHSDVNKAVSLYKKLNKTKNDKDITNESLPRDGWRKWLNFWWYGKANVYIERFSNENWVLRHPQKKQYPRLRFQKILMNWILWLSQKKITLVLTTEISFPV